MAPMAFPAALAPDQAWKCSRPPRDDNRGPGSANSLWRNGAREFFHDQRASKVGDILTVLIDHHRQRLRCRTPPPPAAPRPTRLACRTCWDLETPLARLLPKSFDPTNAISTNSANTSAGDGSVNRSETISLTLAALVTKVLPNGNLIIEGRSETVINAEMRELTVAGIVRPEDITSSNTIKHTQIAEARISYGGKGDLSRLQKTPAGHRPDPEVQPVLTGAARSEQSGFLSIVSAALGGAVRTGEPS